MGRYDYICNSEGRAHYNDEYYSSGYRMPPHGFIPPTFVTYNVNVDEQTLKKAYEEEIANTVNRLLEEATDKQVQQVITYVLNNIDNRVNTTIEEQVTQALSVLQIITNEEIDEITS